MKAQGIIEQSCSPWRSPIVIVPKPDGSIRLCMDYRKVNAVAIFDAFLMLQIDDMIEKVVQACFILTFDLTKGYWQIPMAVLDK